MNIRDIPDMREIRCQVTEEQLAIIKEKAEKLNCRYGNVRNSISRFLQKIASEEILVTSVKDIKSSCPVIQIHIEVCANLVGILEVISEAIKNNDLNIISLNASEESNIATISIEITDRDEYSLDLSKLTKQIYKYTIRDIFQKNKDIREKLEIFLEMKEVKNIIDRDTIVPNDFNNDFNFDSSIAAIKASGILDKKLVKKIYYVLRFRFHLDNSCGTLHEVSKNISSKNISIVKVKIKELIKENESSNYNLVDITLGFYPSGESKVNILTRIDEIKKIIKKSAYVKGGVNLESS